MQAKKAVKTKQRRVKAVETKLQNQRKALNNSKELLNKLNNKSIKSGQVTTTDVINDAPLRVQKEIDNNIVFNTN